MLRFQLWLQFRSFFYRSLLSQDQVPVISLKKAPTLTVVVDFMSTNGWPRLFDPCLRVNSLVVIPSTSLIFCIYVAQCLKIADKIFYQNRSLSSMLNLFILSTHIFKDRKNENQDIWCCKMISLSASKNMFNKDDFLALIIAELHCKSQGNKNNGHIYCDLILFKFFSEPCQVVFTTLIIFLNKMVKTLKFQKNHGPLKIL